MRDMIKKSTLREITGSFSRWIAILAIVALGVGFFSGLKVCREAFLRTGEEYLQGHNFYDFELISTLGVEEANVEEVRAVKGVEHAEGSRSTDIIYVLDEEGAADIDNAGEKVAKLETVSAAINTPALVSGRLPGKKGEIAVDTDRFDESYIGKKIVFTESNDKDRLDMLEQHEFEVVGLVRSPLFLNYERGTTSLLDGNVNCFMYVSEEAWKLEYYTEMFVSLEEKYPLYSNEYDKLIDGFEDSISDSFDATAITRYNDILDEANEKLDDAQKKLDDAKAELADAEKKVAEGEAELNDNIRKLKDAKKVIRDNEKKLADAEKKIEEAEAELEKNRAELLKTKTELEEKKAELEKSKEEMLGYILAAQGGEGSPLTGSEEGGIQAISAEEGNIDAEQLESGMEELEAGIKQVDEGLSQVNAGLKKIEDGFKELEKQKKEYSKGIGEIEKAKKDVTRGEREILKARKKIEDAKTEIEDGKAKIKKNEKKLRKARRDVEDIEEPDTYILTRDKNIGYVCFENDSNIVDGIAKIFPLFFFLVAALVVMTTMTRMVDEHRTQIGVLKALGFTKTKIMGKYLFYALSAALIGGVGGFFGGVHLFPYVIWKAYDIMYGFSDLIYVVDYGVGAASIAAALICVAGASFFSFYREFDEAPAELIRPKAPALGKRIFLERIGLIWNRMSFLHKVSARNIFRYKKRFFMMIIGICGCTALLVTGFGLSDSIKNVVDRQYDSVFKADFTVNFEHTQGEDEKQEFGTDNFRVVREALFVYTVSMDAHHKGQTKSVSLVVIDEDSLLKLPDTDDGGGIGQFIDIHTEKGERLSYPGKGECIINANLAKRLDYKKGDIITLTDSDMNEVSAKITGLSENFVYNYMYINSETYEQQTGKKFAENTAYVLGYRDEDGNGNADEIESGQSAYPYGMAPITDVSKAGAYLMNADNVSGVSVTRDFRDRIRNMMDSLDYVIALIILCAGALAFIVLYNLTNINITERIREIATIKVLGFYPGETAQYVFRENIVLTGISAVVGLPLGFALHRFVMSRVVVDMISFDIHIEPISYMLAVALTFVFAAVVNVFMFFRLGRINMAESLKSIE